MDKARQIARELDMEPYYLYRQKNMAGNQENIGFSKRGKEGLYNILIMEEKQTIIALGAGAACKYVTDNGYTVTRSENVKDPGLYIDRINEMIDRKREKLEEMISFTKSYAASTGAIIAITGAIDLVADSCSCFVIRNGRPEMGRITGTGCQLSAMMNAYVTANPDRKLEAAAAATVLMGLSGEIGWDRMQPGDGNSTYRNRIIDAVFNMDGKTLEEGAKIERR